LYESIALTHQDAVSTIRLNKPPFNLVTVEMLDEIERAYDEIEARVETRAVIFTGAGDRAFCAGPDIKAGEVSTDDPTGQALREKGRAILSRMEIFPKPIVGAVRGWCIGGGTGFPWICDIRIASETTRFRAGDVYLGIIPTWSMCMVRLAHFIGRNKALDLLLLGEDVVAARTLELGLFSRVVPDDRLDAEAMAVAERLAGGAPLAIRAIKETVNTQYREGPEAAAEAEEAWARRIMPSADAHEGFAAFLEKRKPVFKGE
jgi:enoyl-CoA hydratase